MAREEVNVRATMSAFPPAETLESTLAALEDGIHTHRVAFPAVRARRTNGHLQGIAAHFTLDADGETDATVYASVSDFPVGWSACLIERGVSGASQEAPLQTETLAIPQGRHAGGVNVCDGVLVVPMEHDGRDGRVLFYDVADDPSYPALIGAIDGGPGRDADVWPDIADSDPHKASAADMAHLDSSGGGWIAPTSIDSEAGTFLVAVLSEEHFLRFFEVVRDRENNRIAPTGKNATLDVRGLDGWPGGWVDNMSLLNTQDGWRLVVFSAENLIPVLNIQRKKTKEMISVFALHFDEGRAHLDSVSSHEVRIASDPPPHVSKGSPELAARWRSGKSSWRDFCWPSFRWGASISWTGSEFALLMTEWFGDEESLGRPPGWTNESDEPIVSQPGEVMYVQFATNLTKGPFGYQCDGEGATFGYRNAATSHKPPIGTGLLRGLRDAPAMALFAIQTVIFSLLLKAQREPLKNEERRGLGVRAFWAGLVVMGVSVFWSGLVVSSLLAAIGALAALIGIGLYAVGYVASDPRDEVQPLVRIGPAISGALSTIGLAVAVAAFFLEQPIVLGFAAAFAAFFAGLVWEEVGPSRQETEADSRALRWVSCSFVLSLIVAGLLAFELATGSSARLRVVLVLVLVVLLTIAKISATPAVSHSVDAFRTWLLAVAVAVAIVWFSGAVIRWFTSSLDEAISVVRFVAAWMAVFVLSVWGAAEYKRKETPSRLRWGGPGLLMIIASFVSAAFVVPDLGVVLLLVGVAAVIGWYFVWPGEGGLVLALAALVVTFAAVDTDADEAAIVSTFVGESAAETDWVVALGDSFISGEGASRFVDGTNRPGENLCRRAETAWPSLVTNALATARSAANDGLEEAKHKPPIELMSFACSGAEIGEGVRSPQAATEADLQALRAAPGDEELNLTIVDSTAPAFAGTTSQIDALDEWIDSPRNIKYLLISAGGNDAGFVPFIEACLLPGSNCADLVGDFIARASVVQTEMAVMLHDLDRLLKAKHEKGLLVEAPVVVVNPYLDPIGPERGSRCSSLGGITSLLDEREVDAVRAFRGQLNTRVARGVSDFSGQFLKKVHLNADGASVLGRLCQGSESAINWLSIQPPDDAEGMVHENVAALTPRSMWLWGSVHPNEGGHEKIAVTVCELIESKGHEGAESCTGMARHMEVQAELTPSTDLDGDVVEGINQFPEPTCRLAGEDSELEFCVSGDETPDPSELVQARFRVAVGQLVWTLGLALVGGILVGVAGAERRRSPAPAWVMSALQVLRVAKR